MSLFDPFHKALSALRATKHPIPVLLLTHTTKYFNNQKNKHIASIPLDEFKQTTGSNWYFIGVFDKIGKQVSPWGYVNLLHLDKSQFGDPTITVSRYNCFHQPVPSIHPSFTWYTTPFELTSEITLPYWIDAVQTRLELYHQIENAKGGLSNSSTNVYKMMYVSTLEDVKRDALSYFTLQHMMGLRSVGEAKQAKWIAWEQVIGQYRLQGNNPSDFIQLLRNVTVIDDNNHTYKVPFEDALDAIRVKQCELIGGFAIVPVDKLHYIIQQRIRNIHKVATLKASEKFIDDDRIKANCKIFMNRFDQIIQQISGGQVLNLDVLTPGEVMKSAPACMRNMYDIETNLNRSFERLNFGQRRDLYMYLLNCRVPIHMISSAIKSKLVQQYNSRANSELKDRVQYMIPMKQRIVSRIEPQVKQFRGCKRFQSDGICPFAKKDPNRLCRADFVKQIGTPPTEPVINPFHFTMLRFAAAQSKKKRGIVEMTK